MPVRLMIVESPNKVKKIKGILGSGWDVAASVGHIRDLPVKDLGIGMPGYQPQYELSERGADVVKRLRAVVAKADSVYLATDPDREGEAIAWHLSEALKLRNARRVSFDAITPEVILRAIERPRSVDTHLVHAQEARRVLDRLVGYQVSPVLSRQTARRGLSAGRVQSPAVRLVVDREREILAFVEVRHFGAELSFDGNAWRAQWETAPFLKKSSGPSSTEAPKYILDEALAVRAALCRECSVIASSNRIAKQAPPPPFTTSTMLQAASVRLGWKPDMTAGVAQKLFEAGLITYHRTDSQNFSAEALKEVRGYAGKRNLPLPPKSRTWATRGNAQEAHEAIRPTHFATEQAGEDSSQQALYRLIWQRAVASQLADAEWSVNTTRLQSKAGAETFTFKAEGRILAVPGWRSLTAKDDAEEEEDGKTGESCGKVPVLSVGAPALAENGRVLHKKTQPPSRYTQASLIKKLESIGIGRPSTYPAILKNVQTRGYLEDDRKYLRPTELGFLVIDALLTRFSFVEYEFTRDLEQQLDDIAEGKAEYVAVVSAADERLQRELLALGGALKAAPVSAGPLPAFAGRSARQPSGGGPRANWPRRPQTAASGDAAFYDSPGRSPTTSSTTSTGAQQPTTGTRRKRSPAAALTKTPARPARRARKTTEAAAPETTQPGKRVQRTRAAKPTGERRAALPCPVCNAGFVRLASEDAKFYGCSARSETGCRFTVWRTVAGRPLRESDVAALCKKGRTAKLSGFTSKAGRPFEAALVLTGEGKVEFSFQ